MYIIRTKPCHVSQSQTLVQLPLILTEANASYRENPDEIPAVYDIHVQPMIETQNTHCISTLMDDVVKHRCTTVHF
ncbi:MAG: hypothetical protein ACI32N_02590 [Bulleidia sp.]